MKKAIPPYSRATLDEIDEAKLALSLIDLTNLDEGAQEYQILYLCERAIKYSVAGVCVYPQFVATVREILAPQKIKVATVANFPEGNHPLKDTLAIINSALEKGADEIDVVFPYQQYLIGDVIKACDYIRECKKVCGDKTLKVILETGAFVDSDQILPASIDVIAAGADFLKTSTGKIAEGATLLAAIMMLLAIKEAQSKNSQAVGLKISGGIKQLPQVLSYFALVRKIISDDFLKPSTFRIGASSLLDELIPYASGVKHG